MTHRVFILPVWIRIWHWINALLIIALTITGASLHFSDPDVVLVPFALSASIHDFAGIALVVTYTGFVIASVLAWFVVIRQAETHELTLTLFRETSSADRSGQRMRMPKRWFSTWCAVNGPTRLLTL